ncbi:MAG TPA: efflux RND transporter periplasmic adaptor subunit [Flavitalea sp.]|nr:efflux RND transporter periplasmic adaptor subunit [Flavitalea sp.]
MRTIFKLSVHLFIVMVLVSCGDASGKDEKGTVSDKKVKLQKLKDEQMKIGADIKALEDELVKLDPNSVPAKPKLVGITPVSASAFTHFIDLQGTITTQNIVNVAPRGMAGQVRSVHIKEGDVVRKGQVLLKLDDAVVRQQIEQSKIQLAYLRDLYQRRKNLWDQNIGTEVELVSARNNVSNQERQLSLLNEQLSFTTVTAPVSGIAEKVTIHTGEVFTGAPTMGITIVNSTDLKATVNIPENYLSNVKKGTPVVVEVPDVNKKFNTTISTISQVIGSASRGFLAEAKIPYESGLRPNQVARIQIQDYTSSKAITVPLNTVQTDEKGKYVFVAMEENGKRIARKKIVVLGEMYNDVIEIRTGLQEGDLVVTEGFQDLYEGQLLTTNVK